MLWKTLLEISCARKTSIFTNSASSSWRFYSCSYCKNSIVAKQEIIQAFSRILIGYCNSFIGHQCFKLFKNLCSIVRFAKKLKMKLQCSRYYCNLLQYLVSLGMTFHSILSKAYQSIMATTV